MNVPEIGDAIRHDGQGYLCVGHVDHVRRNGSPTLLAVWESDCAQCGERFNFCRPAFARAFIPNRRCDQHRRPGLSVNRRARSAAPRADQQHTNACQNTMPTAKPPSVHRRRSRS